MQQIFNFILKNSNRLLFLLLLILSFSLTIQSHSYHKSKIISSANFFTGGIYQRINNVDEYFGLRAQNEELAQENARLKSILFNQKDTTKLPEIDTIKATINRRSPRSPGRVASFPSTDEGGVPAAVVRRRFVARGEAGGRCMAIDDVGMECDSISAVTFGISRSSGDVMLDCSIGAGGSF